MAQPAIHSQFVHAWPRVLELVDRISARLLVQKMGESTPDHVKNYAILPETAPMVNYTDVTVSVVRNHREVRRNYRIALGPCYECWHDDCQKIYLDLSSYIKLPGKNSKRKHLRAQLKGYHGIRNRFRYYSTVCGHIEHYPNCRKTDADVQLLLDMLTRLLEIV